MSTTLDRYKKDLDSLIKRGGDLHNLLLTVSCEQAELVASEVSGCASCSESAEIHFDWILGDVINLHGMFEFVMDAPVKCLCDAPVSEKTLVDSRRD